LRERKHPYCERPEYARGVRLSLGGSVDDNQGVAVVEIEAVA
jgi:hypothetical protein